MMVAVGTGKDLCVVYVVQGELSGLSLALCVGKEGQRVIKDDSQIICLRNLGYTVVPLRWRKRRGAGYQWGSARRTELCLVHQL